MTYLEWNNIISEYFFNPANAGTDVYLYLTQADIIHLAERHYNQVEDTNEIWKDFIGAIKRGLPGSSGNITAKAKYAYDRRNFLRIDSQEIKRPPYLTYLVFFVLPLIEGIDGTYNANNYYDRLNIFLRNNQINETINTNDFRNNQINSLWEELSNWANIKNNGDLGLFKVMPFSNQNWIYVGKVFSQCIFPPKAIKRLPELFSQAGMIPGSSYSIDAIRKSLSMYGPPTLLLPNSVVTAIQGKSNELGLSIIDIVRREYQKWKGETHENEDSGVIEHTKRNYTIVPLFLQFKKNDNEGLIHLSFRTYSLNDYPEDLNFRNYENLYETNGWSKTLPFEFKETFEINDDFNNWIARFPSREVRIFINAGIYHLSTDYWIETESLSKMDVMYLLCKKENYNSIIEWGKSFHNGDFTEEDLDGLPENYSLFRIVHPTSSHPDFPLLTLYTEKRIEIIGGLKVNFRTFINDFLPEVEITNSDSNEKVYIQYRNTNERILLDKAPSNSNRWHLPDDILLNADFYINIADENLAGNDVAYNLTSSYNSAKKVEGLQLPKRDSFGRLITIDVPQYFSGSNIINPMKSSQRYFCASSPMFLSLNKEIAAQISKATFVNHSGNMLCGFLTLKSVLATEEFFRAFEFYYSKEFSGRLASENINLTRIKKMSLNFYDHIGILDYDYETKKIVVNPPQLIFIPAMRGRKVLLIGGRDCGLIEEIINVAPKYNLQVEISRQFSHNENMLLPDVITIKAFGESDNNYGENDLLEFAKELHIEFSKDYFPQIALHNFSSDIVEYGYTKQLTDEDDYGWARKIFNPENLSFERSETLQFDKSFAMIEYKLNEYTYHYKLWEQDKCYQVDKNWGKFLALRQFNKNVILFDSDMQRVAIPWELPLPRLLSESIMLLSGLAPDLRWIGQRYYRVYENIPGIFTENLFRKLGQQPIKTDLR